MHKVRLNNRIIEVADGTILSDILIKSGNSLPHLCGGKGICKKCQVRVNGKSVLSCQYKIQSDIDVVLPEISEIHSESGAEETGIATENSCFCLDIGTTSLALALVSLDEKEIIKVKTATNPQRAYGSEVITRIEYCNKNGVTDLQKCLINSINNLISEFNTEKTKTMYVAGNTTMLHIFFGIDPSSMGIAPYTPIFLEGKEIQGEEIGLSSVKSIVSLPCISAFVGADLVAGLNLADAPENGKFNLLIDLGTNAEIVLYNKNKIYCTSAAAGPCFEGGNITSGMSATDGAIYAYSDSGEYKTINNKEPKGICGTGLIDIISVLFKNGVIDETGYMEKGEFFITESVKLTQKDIRQFQLAKSAVYSALQAILEEKAISFTNIQNAFISGGFSAKINTDNATELGLLPKELKDKITVLNNSSLLGAVKYACEENDLSLYTQKAEYIDLSTNPRFMDLFIENMEF